LLGSAGLLTALAILGQSRGWALVMLPMALLAVALVPGRGRTIGALALLTGAIAAILPTLLGVYEEFDSASSNSGEVSAALAATLIACGLLFAAGVAWGLVERAPAFGPGQRRRLGTVVVAAFAVCCLGSLIAFTAVRGNPVTEAENAWSEFRHGGKEPDFDGARLGSLGATWRYDYWEVAWREFTEHPLTGVGGDNFGRDYLIHGKSRQTPAYPHSVAIRTLSETGLVGVLLLGGGIVAASIAAARPIRRARGIAAVSAATGLVVFAYFVVHGMLDWFWEFPALGAPAFALLGLATATAARPGESLGDGKRSLAAIVAGGVLTFALALGLALPWLAERELRGAREIAGTDPAGALAKLDRAADLNPLSPLADKTAAVVLRGQGRLVAAERRFRETLGDDPGDPFVYLQLATIASATGGDLEAQRLIRRAAALNPRDAVTRAVQRRLESGRRVTPAAVDRMILRDINTRIGRE
jgi:hypothetical protein